MRVNICSKYPEVFLYGLEPVRQNGPNVREYTTTAFQLFVVIFNLVSGS